LEIINVIKVLSNLVQHILNRVWYVHPTVTLLLQAAPAICLQVIANAAKPSVERLHLRNLFTDGRRYYLSEAQHGFQMRSTSKIPWRRRKRTQVAAVLFGTISEVGSGITRIQISSRMTVTYFLDIFILPLWMGALLIFGPLRPQVALAGLGLIFALSWLWHWYGAVLQATEMVYFIQVALEDLQPAEIPALAAVNQHVIYSQDDFQQQWQKFYDEQKHKSEP
jgi:hypothetical protein